MNLVILVTLPLCYFNFRLFLSWIGRGRRVRCFCLGISEGSCINPFQKVGGPQLFSQKNSKLPRPTRPPPPLPTIKNVPSLKAKKIYGAPMKPSELILLQRHRRFHCVTIFLSDMHKKFQQANATDIA